MYNNGKVEKSSIGSDNRNVLAVTYIDTFINGDQDRSSLFDKNKFGNLYFVLTAEKCAPWSPVIGASSSGKYLEALKTFANTPETKTRKTMGCKDDISDYKENGRSVVTIIPGQGQTLTPGGSPAGAKNQCEFTLQHTKMVYTPGKLIYDIDGKDKETALKGEAFCVRIMASQTGSDDPMLLQLPISLKNLVAANGTLFFAHNAMDQGSVLTGEEAKNTPSLFRIGLSILKNVTDKDWGN